MQIITRIGDKITYWDFPKKLRKKDFTIHREQTLFGPDWKMLQKWRCPHCFLKLSELGNRNYLICRGKKHKKSFVISKKKINKIIENAL